MFRKEEDVINWIYSYKFSNGKRTLEPLRATLAELGNPHHLLKTIHVAGTNGKGSTIAFLSQVLIESGLQVGTFTSPYLTSFGERISINGKPIARLDLLQYASQVQQILNSKNAADFSSFDVITLISFLYFSNQNVDVVIYETGIGGRLDSTNVITPLAAAITNVGHDHAEVLGETQLARAKEKLGIVKEEIPLFTTEEDKVLLAEFKKVCAAKNAILNQPLMDAEFIRTTGVGTLFHFKSYRFVKLSMHGKHQYKNAVLALSILDYLIKTKIFEIDLQAIYKGLDVTSWKGRFEHVQKSPPVILDGAHNIEGIKSLVDVLNHVYPNHRKKVIYSAIATKDAPEMIKILGEVTSEMSFTKGTHPNSIEPAALYELTGYDEKAIYRPQSFKKMINQGIKNLNSNEVLVICGSLYFISDARAHLLKGSV